MKVLGIGGGTAAADHVRVLQSYLPPNTIDVCVLNTNRVGNGLARRYSQSGSIVVRSSPSDDVEIRRMGVIPAAAPLLNKTEAKARHDPEVLAQLVTSLARGFAGAVCDSSIAS